MLDFQKEALSAFRSLGRWQAILMFTMVSQPVMSHIEAYPRLNVREARKQVRDGRDVVSWRDRHGAIVGVGRTRLLDGNRLALDYRFRESVERPRRKQLSQLPVVCALIWLNSGSWPRSPNFPATWMMKPNSA